MVAGCSAGHRPGGDRRAMELWMERAVCPTGIPAHLHEPRLLSLSVDLLSGRVGDVVLHDIALHILEVYPWPSDGASLWRPRPLVGHAWHGREEIARRPVPALAPGTRRRRSRAHHRWREVPDRERAQRQGP